MTHGKLILAGLDLSCYRECHTWNSTMALRRSVIRSSASYCPRSNINSNSLCKGYANLQCNAICEDDAGVKFDSQALLLQLVARASKRLDPTSQPPSPRSHRICIFCSNHEESLAARCQAVHRRRSFMCGTASLICTTNVHECARSSHCQHSVQHLQSPSIACSHHTSHLFSSTRAGSSFDHLLWMVIVHRRLASCHRQLPISSWDRIPGCRA